MSGAGILIGIGANALILGGGVAAASFATGGFGEDAAKAIKEASGVQADAADEAKQAAILRDAKTAKLLAPYQQAGKGAIQQQQALAGTLGPEAQRAAISQIENSPEFAVQMQQGEDAILANASATGGLRGGNTQAALAQFRPQLLSQLINQRYEQLGGLSGQGLQSAGIGAQSNQAGAQLISELIGQRGAAEAGGIIGQQQSRQQGRTEAIDLGLKAAGVGAKLATGGVV